MNGVSFSLLPPDAQGAAMPDVLFRFTVPVAVEMERVLGVNPVTLIARGQVAYGLSALLCYALKHGDKGMTLDKASGLYQEFIDHGGNIQTLQEALTNALQQSGVYGKAETDEDRPPTAPA